MPATLEREVKAALAAVGAAVGASFGDPKAPLLVSVRSGARASMPGMMDTILNFGLNDETVEGPGGTIGQRTLCLRQLPPLHPDVCQRRARAWTTGCSRTFSTTTRTSTAIKWTPTLARPIGARSSRPTRRRSRERPESRSRRSTDEQLWGAIGAVFGSWHNARAKTYRRLHGIPDGWGTAVNVQAMVFGNLGDTLCHRRRFHAQSVHRRARALRRVPAQCSGRGRRRRHPHATAADRGRAHSRPMKGYPRSKRRCRKPIAQLVGVFAKLERSLPRHAGRRVHHRRTASSGCCRRDRASAPPRRRSKSPSTSSPRA